MLGFLILILHLVINELYTILKPHPKHLHLVITELYTILKPHPKLGMSTIRVKLTKGFMIV